MPGFDRTGPRGEGPMTGGARGYCNPDNAGYGSAYGRGYGLGWGRGYRGGFGGPRMGRGRDYGRQGVYGPAYAPPYAMSREEEINMLKDQADMINADLNAINKRIEELKSKPSES